MITERFYFHKHDQAAGETISDFDTALRKIAIHCQFSNTLLRDCIACGLHHETIQRRLLSESSLSYKKLQEAWKPLTKTLNRWIQ